MAKSFLSEDRVRKFYRYLAEFAPLMGWFWLSSQNPTLTPLVQNLGDFRFECILDNFIIFTCFHWSLLEGYAFES
jgi:hypothetical protein